MNRWYPYGYLRFGVSSESPPLGYLHFRDTIQIILERRQENDWVEVKKAGTAIKSAGNIKGRRTGVPLRRAQTTARFHAIGDMKYRYYQKWDFAEEELWKDRERYDEVFAELRRETDGWLQKALCAGKLYGYGFNSAGRPLWFPTHTWTGDHFGWAMTVGRIPLQGAKRSITPLINESELRRALNRAKVQPVLESLPFAEVGIAPNIVTARRGSKPKHNHAELGAIAVAIASENSDRDIGLAQFAKLVLQIYERRRSPAAPIPDDRTVQKKHSFDLA